MTKTIRIENADTANYKVKVSVQERRYNHDLGVIDDTWVTTKVVELDYPTSMFTDYLTTTKRFIVEENGVHAQ